MAHKNEHIDWDVSDQERVSRAVRRKVRRRRRKFPALLLLLMPRPFLRRLYSRAGHRAGPGEERGPPPSWTAPLPQRTARDQDSGENSGGTDASDTGSETTGDAGVQEPAEPEIPDSSPIAQEPEIPAVDTTAWNCSSSTGKTLCRRTMRPGS